MDAVLKWVYSTALSTPTQCHDYYFSYSYHVYIKIRKMKKHSISWEGAWRCRRQEILNSVVLVSTVFVLEKRCLVAKPDGTYVYPISSTYQRISWGTEKNIFTDYPKRKLSWHWRTAPGSLHQLLLLTWKGTSHYTRHGYAWLLALAHTDLWQILGLNKSLFRLSICTHMQPHRKYGENLTSTGYEIHLLNSQRQEKLLKIKQNT